jgi:hypothetical protein
MNNKEDESMILMSFTRKNMCFNPIFGFIADDQGKLTLIIKPRTESSYTFTHSTLWRWCDRIKVKIFRIRSLCFEEPKYLDLHFFGSQNNAKKFTLNF